MYIRGDLLVRNLGLSLFLVSASACGLDPVQGSTDQGSSASTAPDTKAKTSTQDTKTENPDPTDTEKGTTGSSPEEGSSPTEESSSTQDETSSTSGSTSGSTTSSSDPSTEDTSSPTGSTGDTTDTSDTNTEPEKLDCSKIKFTGFDLGDVPNSVSLRNSDGEQVELRDYCNETLVVMSGVPN